ncbi:hypothetical protein [Dyadobacter helix]|uniref:hypothetical protein n=1 Tax=Dyadobacter helix TaxID=2822344 RepID=UPI001BFC5B50|nr:hypothetical protein [Dyadobacter sp. CECT 9275]
MKKIKLAKTVVEAWATGRYKIEKETYDEKIKALKRKEGESGKKPRGKVPQEPENKPNSSDQL